jgi:[ribosomal protein S5]-alanine N-acetyltransferase
MERMTIATPRLILLAATCETMDAAAADDPAALSRGLSVQVPGDWPPRIDDDGRMAKEGFKYVRDTLKRDPSLVGWWGWWVVLPEPAPVLIGAVSTKGPPDGEGTVEVSYGIVDSHQGKGYATEAVAALVKWVRENGPVKRIVAETYPHLAASIAVMEKCGMSFLGEGSEPGTVRYALPIARS